MKEKVTVTGVPETMIQTLYARAKESGKENAKIHDDMAAEMVSGLDYDFSKADQDKAMSYGVIARTIVLDEMVEKYLSGHPNTIVVNIASGLDTRCYRMQGKYVRWYNVDLPETMKIRDVLQMMSIIEKTFRNVTVMIETMSPFVVKHIKEKSIEGSHAKFTWGVKNGKIMQQLVPAFRYKGEVSLVEGMKKCFRYIVCLERFRPFRIFPIKLLCWRDRKEGDGKRIFPAPQFFLFFFTFIC